MVVGKRLWKSEARNRKREADVVLKRKAQVSKGRTTPGGSRQPLKQQGAFK
jgi:hypothetical protein